MTPLEKLIYDRIAECAAAGLVTPATTVLAVAADISVHTAERLIASLVESGRIGQEGERAHKVFIVGEDRTITIVQHHARMRDAMAEADSEERDTSSLKGQSDAFSKMMASRGYRFDELRLKPMKVVRATFSRPLSYGVAEYGR